MLVGLDTTKAKVAAIADDVIATARSYNTFIAGLTDEDDKAFAAQRFADSVGVVKARIESEPEDVRATIVAFFDGMGFVPKSVESE